MPVSPDQPSGKPLKRRRITRACDYCHQRSVRCQQVGDGPSCRNCLDFGQPCTFNRVPKKRGAPPKTRSVDGGRHSDGSNHPASPASLAIRDGRPESKGRDGIHGAGGDGAPVPVPASASASAPVPVPGQDDEDPGSKFIQHGFRPAAATSDSPVAGFDLTLVAPPDRILGLVDLYFEIVYPIFPFFHRPSFLRRISQKEYTTNQSLLAVTMAVCALVSGRVCDGAVSNPRRNTLELSQTPPQVFYERAREELSRDPTRVDIHTLRAHAILAITAIQYGYTRDMHYHIGQYHTLVAMDAFHDEAEWPQDIGIIEREERRRLFWSIYTLDIYTSIVWGGVVRGREQQYKVSYPLEVDDELITETTPAIDARPERLLNNSSGNHRPSWLYGWNFTTDLYRILEHALARFRESKSNEGRQTGFLHDIFFRDRAENSITVASVRDNVMQMYLTLPDCFKQTPQNITYDPRKDLYGFQAANITATVQLLRMVLFSVDEGSVSLNDRCQIASEVIEAFWSIPDAYQQAISAPLLHHLGGIGFILGGSALSSPEGADPEESEWLYARLRTVLLDLARLLSRLEGLVTSARVSERLETQVARIDERIMALRQQRQYKVDDTGAPVQTNTATLNAPPTGISNFEPPAPQQQTYAGAQVPPQGPTYGQAPMMANAPMQSQVDDWGNIIVFPNDMFGDFSWAINSL